MGENKQHTQLLTKYSEDISSVQSFAKNVTGLRRFLSHLWTFHYQLMKKRVNLKNLLHQMKRSACWTASHWVRTTAARHNQNISKRSRRKMKRKTRVKRGIQVGKGVGEPR